MTKGICLKFLRIVKISIFETVFLTCVSHTAHVVDIGWTSVCLSIRHTLVLCRNGSTYRQTVLTA